LVPWLLLAAVACSNSDPAAPPNGMAAGGASAGELNQPAAGAAGAAPGASAGASVAGSSAVGGGGSGGAPPTAGSGGTLATAGAPSSAGAAGLAAFPALTENVTVHVAGDSTAAIFPAADPTKRVGWAAVAQPFFMAGLTMDDEAQSGRSSKSFIDEGFWSGLKSKVHSGDYVFIEFGHNDEKTDDVARYTDAATTFRTYLKTYISEARAAGGFPVLLTPISRRKYAAGKITPSHGAYPAAVIAVGSETGTPVIDLTDKTRIWLEALGPIDSIPFFAAADTTHLSALGAPEVAKLVMQGIRELNLPIAVRLVSATQ
jgi:lysophospholipase L1-like esterase